MARLVDYEIEFFCKEGIVKDFDPILIRPNSLDFRLGHLIKVEECPINRHAIAYAVECQQEAIANGLKEPHPLYVKVQRKIKETSIFRTIDISHTTEQNPFPVSPKSFLLAATFERLNVSPVMTVDIVLRSTSARKGLNHSLAGLCDSGYQGNPTLELSNLLTWHPVEIWYGMPLGQFLFDIGKQPEKLYAESSGNYQSFTEPTEGKS